MDADRLIDGARPDRIGDASASVVEVPWVSLQQ
jgi:hypothetical protein